MTAGVLRNTDFMKGTGKKNFEALLAMLVKSARTKNTILVDNQNKHKKKFKGIVKIFVKKKTCYEQLAFQLLDSCLMTVLRNRVDELIDS